MPIDWNAKESYQRLLAAMQAASPQNHNYRLIATYYGEGATYDSIEGRFRKIKADAAILKAEIDNGERPEAPPRTSANSTPRKPRARKPAAEGKAVKTGRVTKAKGRAIKKEAGNNAATATEDNIATSPVHAAITPEQTGSDSNDVGEYQEEIDWAAYDKVEMTEAEDYDG